MKKIKAAWRLMKPRPTLMATCVAALGFLLGSWPSTDWGMLFKTFLGTFLLGGGAAALNQYGERKEDARMKRTQDRPLPAGRLTEKEALLVGIAAALSGTAYLALSVNVISAVVGAVMIVSYVFFYTPLKKRTEYSAWVGAFAGALPPVLGWAAARGSAGLEAAVLFSILFLWQFPHVLAIGWVYRDDYARGGFRVLGAGDAEGLRTLRAMALFTFGLFAVSLLPALLGLAGGLYFAAALILGLAFLVFNLWLTPPRLERCSRKYNLATVTYLPLLLGFLLMDKIF